MAAPSSGDVVLFSNGTPLTGANWKTNWNKSVVWLTTNYDVTFASVTTSGNVTVGGSLAIGTNLTVPGTLNVTGATVLNGATTISGGIAGNTTLTGTLGVSDVITAPSFSGVGSSLTGIDSASLANPITGAIVLTPSSNVVPITINQAQANLDGLDITHSSTGTHSGMYINETGTGYALYVSDSDGSSGDIVYIAGSSQTGKTGLDINMGSGGGARTMIQFRISNNAVGNIQSGPGGTSFQTLSDERLKENVVDTKFGISDLVKLQVKEFNFKADPSKNVVTGLIAQQVQLVYPGVVGSCSDEMLAIDYGKFTPLLIKAVQDQQNIINDLKARIDVLEKK